MTLTEIGNLIDLCRAKSLASFELIENPDPSHALPGATFRAVLAPLAPVTPTAPAKLPAPIDPRFAASG